MTGQARLVELGSSYGAMPAHDGLWESAAATAHSLPARLAVEACVHEARGLDVLPQTVARCLNACTIACFMSVSGEEQTGSTIHSQAHSFGCARHSRSVSRSLRNHSVHVGRVHV